jgi:hypothetical protein
MFFSDENIFRKLIIINSKRMLLSFPSFNVGCFVLPSIILFSSQLAALINDSAGVIATNTAAIQLANAREKPR